jgi:hypothetical protein
MDTRAFAAQTRAPLIANSRRRLLALLATLPLFGGIASLLLAEDGLAKDRRRRRKQRHRRRKKPGTRKRGCKPKSRAKVCAGECGRVKNRKTCGKTVNCAACACNPACPAGDACVNDTCEPLACGQGGRCRVFTTSTTHTGKLGGLAGADDICQGLAGAAGLPGAYRAWLSDSTGSPSTRFVRSTGPYQRVDGVTVAHDWANLTSGTLLAPLIVTEQGNVVPDDVTRLIWTCTAPTGVEFSGSDCEDWTTERPIVLGGFVGSADEVTAAWSGENSYHSCNGDLRLYCFQQSE